VQKLTIVALGFVLAFVSSARADDQAEVKAILESAAKALGGADKALKLSDISLKGKTTISEGGTDVAISFDLSSQNYDRMRMEMTALVMGMTKRATLVLNADNAWARDSDRDKVEDAPKEIVPILQQILLSLRAAGHPAGLSNNAQLKLAAGGVGTVGEVQCNLLRISRKDHSDITLFFDTKSGLPLKGETMLKDPGGAEEKNYEFHFSDYKDIAGVKHFGKFKIVRDSKDLAEVELSDFKVGEKFEANTFEKP
jgi:outer membrane lipoprotein-sorting protein